VASPKKRARVVQAWIVEPGGPEGGALRLVERPAPVPGPGEVLVAVHACGVCRTDLHLRDGDLPAKRPGVVPGHQIVGEVVGVGPGASRFGPGQRVGVAWLRSTCGRCRFCLRDQENLCEDPRFTGWDADGGFTELAVAPEAYAYPLPDGFDDLHAAPLLCAGIIGYRALVRARVPEGGSLGLWGFGASAHLTLQVARHLGARVHVFTRAPAAQELARRLGAASAQGVGDPSPEPLASAILFAPAGELVPVVMAALDRGGTLAVAGVHLTDVPALDYQAHLFEERTLTSVTANTRADGRALLALASTIPLAPEVTTYPFEAVDRALADLAADRVVGTAVINLRP
jgi:alcohol dehydrogenase, propanol-preferring